MANDHQLLQVLSFLRSKHIVVSSKNEWLLGCYDYYRSQNQHLVSNMQALKNFVYEQWLLADLRDVAEPCLPLNADVVDKMILNDAYVLQVDCMVNIAESSYSQLQKIQKLNSENLDVTEEEAQKFEPKAKRMLKLTCTDGVRTVFGMEYEPIQVLQEPYIPGCKILVTGPVECRKGVILLTSHSVTVLGGEVDSLITENAQVNILIRKLDEFTENGTQDSVQAVTDRGHDLANNSRSMNTTNGVTSSAQSRPENENTIVFAQFDDVNMNDDDDEIFLDDRLCEVENLLNVRSNNYLDDTSNENKLSTIGSNDSNTLVRSKSQLSSPFTLEGTPSPSTFSSGSRADEQIVPSNRPSFIDRFIQPENDKEGSGVTVSNALSSSSIASLCPDISVTALNCLYACKAMRPELTYRCNARVTKLRSKPRIKNEKWLMSVDMGDNEATLEVNFHSSFLDSIFGYSAVEVLSQKDRIKLNPSIKEKIDQIIKQGAMKILSLQGEFYVKIIADNDLPTVMRVRENTG